jgi:hypothetical protein
MLIPELQRLSQTVENLGALAELRGLLEDGAGALPVPCGKSLAAKAFAEDGREPTLDQRRLAAKTVGSVDPCDGGEPQAVVSASVGTRASKVERPTLERGSSTRNVVPVPSSLSTTIRPP